MNPADAKAMAGEGGGRGIRTPGPLTGTFALQANALDHYAIPPFCHSPFVISLWLMNFFQTSDKRLTTKDSQLFVLLLSKHFYLMHM